MNSIGTKWICTNEYMGEFGQTAWVTQSMDGYIEVEHDDGTVKSMECNIFKANYTDYVGDDV